MSNFFSSLFKDIKNDLKSDLRVEARNLTKEAIKDVKDSFKPKNEQVVNQGTNQVVQPSQTQVDGQVVSQTQMQSASQVSQPNSAPIMELSKDDKVFGKSIDEYREIFQSLKNKHGDDLSGIYSDPDYQKLDAETKEYLNRVYIPTIEQSIKVLNEANDEITAATKEKVEKTDAMYNEFNKDGVMTVEEDNQLTQATFDLIGDHFEEVGNIAPKYMDKFGDIANDLSNKVENEDLSAGLQKLGDGLKNSDYQEKTKEDIQKYASSYDNLNEKLPQMQQVPQNLSSAVELSANAMNNMEDGLKQVGDVVGMDEQDYNKAFEEGKEMDGIDAATQIMNSFQKLGESSSKQDKEQMANDMKDLVNSSFNAIGSAFKDN